MTESWSWRSQLNLVSRIPGLRRTLPAEFDRQVLDLPGYDPATLAEKTGKSESRIYSRLALMQLIPDVADGVAGRANKGQPCQPHRTGSRKTASSQHSKRAGARTVVFRIIWRSFSELFGRIQTLEFVGVALWPYLSCRRDDGSIVLIL